MKNVGVTIGICAYNESSSIHSLLTSLSKQIARTYVLKRVFVISDASEDSTVKGVQTVGWKKISLIQGRNRLGKPARMNMLFKKAKSEILITLDADVVIRDTLFIEKMVRMFRNKSVMLVSANATPLEGNSLLEQAVISYYAAREYFRKFFDYGTTAYGFRGTALGFRKEFYLRLHIPTNILNDDAFCYFVCRQMGYVPRQVKKAIVYFKSPSTVSDFFAQHERYVHGGEQLRKELSEDLVNQYSAMPLDYKIRISLYQFLSNPVAYLLFKSIFAYLAFRSIKHKEGYISTWSMIVSSKPNDAVLAS